MSHIHNLYVSMTTNWHPWANAAVIVIAFWLGGFIFRKIAIVYIEFLTRKTETKIDDIIVACLKPHLIYWPVLLGAYFASKILPVNPSTLAIFDKATLTLFFLSITFLAANIASGIFKEYGERMKMPSTSLTENVIRIVILLTGGLVILAHLGISIAPLLTALGVGSLAVALALQDTLSNLFAGFHIIASKLVKTGDFIRLDNGDNGYVVDIGWRATRIRELSNNIIVIPNSKLTTSILKNYDLPEKEIAVVVPVGVAYSSDLEKVEKVTVEVAESVMKDVLGGVPGFAPLIRYTAFADSSINFNVVMRGREFTDQGTITHEFIKRLHKRYDKEKIELPFPQRVVQILK
jgi:small-conductance mechanosensitive channel